MKIVAVIGSPRKEGNCDTIVKELLNNVDADTTTYYLYDQKIGPCHADMACVNQDCILNDDGNTVINDILDADLFIFATPIYFGQMSAPSKALIDRFYQVFVNPDKSFKGKKAITVFTQGLPENGFETYINSTNAMFGSIEMELVGSITAMGTSKKGDKEELSEALTQAKEIASKL